VVHAAQEEEEEVVSITQSMFAIFMKLLGEETE